MPIDEFLKKIDDGEQISIYAALDNFFRVAYECIRLRDEVKRLTGSVDQASAWQEAIEDIASYMSVGVEGCDPVEAVARIKKAGDDFVRVAVQRAGRAEAALKEAQEQEPVAWLCGKDVTTHKEYAEWFMRFTQEDCTQLYAHPVPAAPAVAVPAVPEEWREVLRECADDLAIELDQRYGDSRKYPSEQRKYEAEMQPVYRARSLLQSTGDKK